jgi:ribosomal protein S18 acetylase RimI-like enzyme
MNGFQIRRANEADAGAILRCLAAAFESYRESYTAGALDDTVLSPATVGQRLAQMEVFVAEEPSGEVVGTIACQAVSPEEGHLRGMAVLPNWQGTGVAENLLSSAEFLLSAAGCKWISLDTTEPLKRAIRFYEKHGYKASGKVGKFFGMPLYEYVKQLTG